MLGTAIETRIRELALSFPATVTDEATLAAALEWPRDSYWLKAPAKLREAAWS